MSYGARSPDIDPMDMSMDFDAVMKTMAHYVSYPKVSEVLSIVRNSDTRRSQVKVAQPDLPDATWKGLPWKVVSIRAVQGHNRAVVENAKISSLVKQVFTLDPNLYQGRPRHSQVAQDEPSARFGARNDGCSSKGHLP